MCPSSATANETASTPSAVTLVIASPSHRKIADAPFTLTGKNSPQWFHTRPGSPAMTQSLARDRPTAKSVSAKRLRFSLPDQSVIQSWEELSDSPSSSIVNPTNARLEPSGLKTGEDQDPWPWVMRRGDPPSTDTIQMSEPRRVSQSSLRLAAKATWRPSGDHVGDRSLQSPSVSCRTSLDSTSTVKMWDRRSNVKPLPSSL